MPSCFMIPISSELPQRSMSLSSRNLTISTPRTEIGSCDSHRVEAERKRVEATDARAIVLDLAGLTFLSSSGIHLLLRAKARSRADSNGLTLLRGSPACNASLRSAASKTRCRSPTDSAGRRTARRPATGGVNASAAR